MKFDNTRRNAMKGLGLVLASGLVVSNLKASEKVKNDMLILMDDENIDFQNGLKEANQKNIMKIDLVGNFINERKKIENEIAKNKIKTIAGMLDFANFILLEQILKEQNSKIAMEISHVSYENVNHFLSLQSLTSMQQKTMKNILKDENWAYMMGFVLGNKNFNAHVNLTQNVEKITTNIKNDTLKVSFITLNKGAKNV